MSQNDLNKIRPIYTELQGYLSQAPTKKGSNDSIRDSALWEQLNLTIDELNEASGDNYDKFKIVNIKRNDWGHYIGISNYRSNLNGLIMRLHGKYFSTELSPFSGSPSTIVSQNQSQDQTTQVSMIMNFQSLIDEKIHTEELGDEEKSFLEKIKSSLSGIKNYAQLVGLIISTAKSMGISIDQLGGIFK